MAHKEQLNFVATVARIVPGYFRGTRVLEVGSLDINGSIRGFFDGCEYCGIDVEAGPGVDVVCQGQVYDGPSDDFDLVASCEAMEHNPFWRQTFGNMVRVCKPQGMILMTCATVGRREHVTVASEPDASPLTVELGWNYYRNLSASSFDREALRGWFERYAFWVNWESFDLYFCGIKKGRGRSLMDEGAWGRLQEGVNEYVASENCMKRHRIRKVLAAGTGDAGFNALRKLAETIRYVAG